MREQALTALLTIAQPHEYFPILAHGGIEAYTQMVREIVRPDMQPGHATGGIGQ
jgi:hypothetical protein